ncbi:hypothetical protein HHI36_005075 [Cryptolaemus montrouzieri]|uniref:Uncharacterized protein n=1 Tax=Cryptolaemus montrouzieri TaxID=559131 RepID=A0ABD2NUL3_9CUCU
MPAEAYIQSADSDGKGDKLKAMNHTNIGVTNLESGNDGYYGAHNSVDQDVPRSIICPEQLEAAILEVQSGTVMKEVQNLNKEKSKNDEGQWRRVSNRRRMVIGMRGGTLAESKPYPVLCLYM